MAEIQAQVKEYEGMPSRNETMGFFRKDAGNPGAYELWYQDSRGRQYRIAGNDIAPNVVSDFADSFSSKGQTALTNLRTSKTFTGESYGDTRIQYVCPVDTPAILFSSRGTSTVEYTRGCFWINGQKYNGKTWVPSIKLLSAYDRALKEESGTYSHKRLFGVYNDWIVMTQNTETRSFTLMIGQNESLQYLSKSDYEKIGTTEEITQQQINSIGWSLPELTKIDSLDTENINLPTKDGEDKIFINLSDALKYLNEKANTDASIGENILNASDGKGGWKETNLQHSLYGEGTRENPSIERLDFRGSAAGNTDRKTILSVSHSEMFGTLGADIKSVNIGDDKIEFIETSTGQPNRILFNIKEEKNEEDEDVLALWSKNKMELCSEKEVSVRSCSSGTNDNAFEVKANAGGEKEVQAFEVKYVNSREHVALSPNASVEAIENADDKVLVTKEYVKEKIGFSKIQERLLMTNNCLHPNALFDGIVDATAPLLILGLYSSYSYIGINGCPKYLGENMPEGSAIKIKAQFWSLFGPLGEDVGITVNILRNSDTPVYSHLFRLNGNTSPSQMMVLDERINFALKKGDSIQLVLVLEDTYEQFRKSTQAFGWKLEVWETDPHVYKLTRSLVSVTYLDQGTGTTDGRQIFDNSLLPGPRINNMTMPLVANSGRDVYPIGTIGIQGKDPVMTSSVNGWRNRTSSGTYNKCCLIASFQTDGASRWDDCGDFISGEDAMQGPDLPILLWKEGISYNNIDLDSIEIIVSVPSMNILNKKLKPYNPDGWTVAPDICYFIGNESTQSGIYLLSKGNPTETKDKVSIKFRFNEK